MRYIDKRMAELGQRKRPINTNKRSPRASKYAPGTTEKPCTVCKMVKPLEAFSELKVGALGRQARCKSCINSIGKRYTRSKLERKAGRPRPAVCDACGTMPPMARALHWDHDHALERFRGWLCHYCNTALGCVRDNPEQLQQLINYLKRGGGPA